MFSSSTASTRRVAPSHKPWVPHPYQKRAVEFLTQQNAAALFLDPGLGKTSITLAAFDALRSSGLAKRMLVVAPLRVVQTVWAQEAKKWTQFRDLRFSVLHGPKKAERLRDDADIWLINPEGCQWLSNAFYGRTLPFDTVAIDELTKFKNHRSVRSKALRPRLKGVRRRWGLTGTPIPNGYLDLFGQFLMLDDGAALGKYVTHYRDQYFQPDYKGFDYTLQPGAAQRIEQRIAPYVLRMAAEDYLDLPPLVDDIRYVDLEPEARKTYTQMKKSMLAELPEGTVTGANAAAVYSKLKQMANGAVYLEDVPGEARTKAHLHDAKLDAIEELVEELCGAPLLVAYEFNHDLERLKARLGKDLPHLGAGVNGKQTAEIVDAWNRGELPILFAHPASAGHGLNLQGSGASHIAWFGPTWDLELYEQFIQRVHRQGTTSQRIVNHIFCARDTIDDLVIVALRDKATTQEKLLASLSTEILRDAEPGHGAAVVSKMEHEDMEVRKLSRQSLGAAAQPAEERRTITPKGWGRPASAEPVEPEQGRLDPVEQRQAIMAKIAPPEPAEEPETPPARVQARSMFSPAVQEAILGSSALPAIAPATEDARAENTATPTKPKRAAKPAKEPATEDNSGAAFDPFGMDSKWQEQNLRQWAINQAICANDGSGDVVATAQRYVDFIKGVE